MKRVYLDNAAATPVDSRVLKSMLPFFTEEFYNPSALYEGARKSKAALDEARSVVSSIIGARPSEIFFTAGGTESANLAIQGVMNNFKDADLVLSAIEHDAVSEPANLYHHKLIPVDKDGRINLSKAKMLISENTVLVSVMLVNNEIGTVQPIKELSKIINDVRKDRLISGNKMPIYLHTDACQAPLYLDIDVNRLGIDLMTLNGGKIHGPKQSGILYVKTGTNLMPLIKGGGQEFGLRSGTENVAFAVGFARALQLTTKNKHNRIDDVVRNRDYFIKLLQENFNAEINGSMKNRIANNVHVIFPESDNERVLFSLDDNGVDAATGSACSASKDEPSRVLRAIGLSDIDAQSSIRFSLGADTTKEDIDFTIKKLKIALKA